MFKKLRKKIEGKRNSKNLFWKSSVFAKDFIWRIIKCSKQKSLCPFVGYLKENRMIAWKTNKNRIEIELTSFCNLRCTNCNRSIKQAPTDEFISPKQIEKFVKESVYLNWNWNDIKIMGGEPTLHPELFKVIEIVKEYKDFNPHSNIEIVTNGYGKKVNNILSKLPSWLNIVNTNKKCPVQKFESFNIAPIDLKKYQNTNFLKACRVTEICGLGLTRYGYYICGPGASADRIFGFDIGIKKLSQLNDSILKKQKKILCKYCGHYKYKHKNNKNSKDLVTGERMSPTWIKAYKRYKKQKPEMSLY